MEKPALSGNDVVTSIVVPSSGLRAAFLPSGNAAGGPLGAGEHAETERHPRGSAITRRTMAKRVGVVGGGIMGSGIAEESARAGLDVVLPVKVQPAYTIC